MVLANDVHYLRIVTSADARFRPTQPAPHLEPCPPSAGSCFSQKQAVRASCPVDPEPEAGSGDEEIQAFLSEVATQQFKVVEPVLAERSETAPRPPAPPPNLPPQAPPSPPVLETAASAASPPTADGQIKPSGDGKAPDTLVATPPPLVDASSPPPVLSPPLAPSPSPKPPGLPLQPGAPPPQKPPAPPDPSPPLNPPPWTPPLEPSAPPPRPPKPMPRECSA